MVWYGSLPIHYRALKILMDSRAKRDSISSRLQFITFGGWLDLIAMNEYQVLMSLRRAHYYPELTGNGRRRDND